MIVYTYTVSYKSLESPHFLIIFCNTSDQTEKHQAPYISLEETFIILLIEAFPFHVLLLFY